MTTTTNLGTLVKMQKGRDAAARRAATTTWRTHTLTVRKVMPSSIGVGTGLYETVQDQRDGLPRQREKLVFLSRRHVHVISGLLREGESIVVDVPSWLAERTGLDQVQGLVP